MAIEACGLTDETGVAKARRVSSLTPSKSKLAIHMPDQIRGKRV